MATTIMQTKLMKDDPPSAPRQPRSRLLVRDLALLSAFALLFYPLSYGEVEPSNGTLPVVRASKELPNVHVVHSYLLRGGAPTLAGIDELKQMGVKTIIDLRRNEQRIAAERQHAIQLGINYVSLPMGNFVPSERKQAEFLRIVQDASVNPAKAPVFVHCSHGSDRTSFMVALWRTKHDGWTIGQAITEMLQRGFFFHRFQKNLDSQSVFD